MGAVPFEIWSATNLISGLVFLKDLGIIKMRILRHIYICFLLIAIVSGSKISIGFAEDRALTEEDRNLPTSYKLAGELLGLAAGISYAKSASKRAPPSYGLNGSGKPYGKPPGKSGYTHVSSPAAQYGMHNPRTEEDRAQGMA